MSSEAPSFAQAVREQHRFDEAKLEAYLQREIPDFGPDMSVLQFQGGASNPTFLITTGSGETQKRYVLRKKPPGQLLASAHQVDREYKIMKALEGLIPVPHMRVLCEDPEVIGTAFYVMDFLQGRILRDPKLPGMTPAERTAVFDDLNATLAKLHKVDIAAAGLSDFGRRGNYFERQIARWIRQYRDAELETIPEMEALIEALPGMVPPEDLVSIAHGDYRLENVMYHPTEPKLIAVLDWELSTIGHPFADIAYNCILWRWDDEGWGTVKDVDYAATGIPTEAEYIAAYCRRTGRDRIDNWNFYLAFSIFRLASIGQGVYRRVLAGNAADDRRRVNSCPSLAKLAWKILNEG